MERMVDCMMDDETVTHLHTTKVNNQEKRNLRTLARDFGLLDREDVQEIIDTCKSYSEGQQYIMRVYDVVYMH